MSHRWGVVLLALCSVPSSNCSNVDPATEFMASMDQAPPEKRPPGWEKTKALMGRRAPATGEPAPDFTLKTVDGSTAITRSTYHPGRPMVLVFGSFT
jgi:hypothetical protein